MENENRTILVESKKNVGTALILTFLFGPLGMLYSTIKGGVIMFIISLIVAVFTAGLGIFITWPICMVWTYMAVKKYNDNLH